MDPNHLTLKETTSHSPLKVYTDATTSEKTSLSVAGFVFCDHNGQVLDTLSQQLGTNIESCQAEAKALQRIIDTLSNISHVQHAIFYSDCKPALSRVITSTDTDMYEYCTLEWLPREKNQLADMVADTGLRRGATHTPTANRAKYDITD
jgi:ribonuclease HI